MGVRGKNETARKAPQLHYPPTARGSFMRPEAPGGYGFTFMGFSRRMSAAVYDEIERYAGEVMEEAVTKMNQDARRRRG